MKRHLESLLFIAIVVGACQKDKLIGPSDLLYKRWHLTQTRPHDSNTWQVQSTDAYYTVEYRPDGNLVYQRNGVTTQAGCCAPSKFNRQGVMINYSDWTICPTALCLSIKETIITQLTENLLELDNGYSISQYEIAN